MNDGSLRVLNAQRQVIFHILFLEVKEDTGTNAGNPAMEIGAYFGRFMKGQYERPAGPAAAVLWTCCPAFGLELTGNVFRCVSRGCYSCLGTFSCGSLGRRHSAPTIILTFPFLTVYAPLVLRRIRALYLIDYVNLPHTLCPPSQDQCPVPD